jgi:hypothetical protein
MRFFNGGPAAGMRVKLREMVPHHPDGVGVKPSGDLQAASGKTC